MWSEGCWRLGRSFELISFLGRWGVILRYWRARPIFKFISQRNGKREGENWEPTKPSSKPSPVVAQLGTTNQILSFSWLSLRASVTSAGFIAEVPWVSKM